MISFSWEKGFNAGIEAIDSIHRKIFDSMIAIYKELIINHLTHDSLNVMMHDLESLSRAHFNDEEDLMTKLDYPLTEEHKHLHRLYLLHMTLLKLEMNKGNISATINKFIKIREDFITHMRNEVILLKEHINKNLLGVDMKFGQQ